MICKTILPSRIVAKLGKLKGVTRLTKEDTTMGTVYYMSPEQTQGLEVDRRSDIFSFGVVLYEMITGHLPFSGEYEAAISYSILHEKPEPLARYKSGVSDGLQRIVDKALDKDRETRYQHIEDLLADLKRERRKSSGTITPPGREDAQRIQRKGGGNCSGKSRR